jgi:hypothetical protein
MVHSAGFAGFFLDKEFEEHGVGHSLLCLTNLILCHLTTQLAFIDKEKAKHRGKHYSLFLK